MFKVRRIPSTHDHAPVIRVVLNGRNEFRELIKTFALVVRMHVLIFRSKVSPLKTIYWAQIPLLTMRQSKIVEEISAAILVPYFDAIVRQNLGVRGASHKPKELFAHTLPVNTLSCEKWKLATQ